MGGRKFYLGTTWDYYCRLTNRDCPNLKERAMENCKTCEILIEHKKRKKADLVK